MQPWSQPKRPAPEPYRPQQPRRPTEAEQRQARLRAAAKYVADGLWDGWDQAVAERVAMYVTRRTWKRIRSGSPSGRCHRLAQLAKDILDGKHDLHEVAGWAASTLARRMGRPRIERVFAAELAARIPQPTDRPLNTLAKSIRITGVMLCAAAGRDLRRCECLLDLTEAESREQVERLLLDAADNYWTTHYQPPPVKTDPTPL